MNSIGGVYILYDEQKKNYIRIMENRVDRLKFVKFNRIGSNIKPFINQFTTLDQKFVAYKLIELLIYYDSKYLIEYVKHILNDLRRRVYIENISKNSYLTDSEYEESWDNFIKTVVFVPLSDKTVTDGAYTVLQYFKDFFSLYRLDEDANISSVEKISKHIEQGVKNVIIVDDFVGSGFQISTKFLPKVFNFDGIGYMKLIDFININSDIKFEFFVISSSEIGFNSIKNNGFEVSCIDLYNSDYNILEYNKIFWTSYEEYKLFYDVLTDLVESNNLAFKNTLNLPILFEHSSPKPSHPIYWNENPLVGWKALRSR